MLVVVFVFLVEDVIMFRLPLEPRFSMISLFADFTSISLHLLACGQILCSTPHLSNKLLICVEVKTLAPSVVMFTATPQRVKYCLSTYMMWYGSSFFSLIIDNQLEYLSTMAR